eukprot:353445-Chlamydomonas_euryale.AAC.11
MVLVRTNGPSHPCYHATMLTVANGERCTKSPIHNLEQSCHDSRKVNQERDPPAGLMQLCNCSEDGLALRMDCCLTSAPKQPA